MGLDISGPTHGFRAGSYSGFNSFREWLAQKVGYESYTDLLQSTEGNAGEWINARSQNKNAASACPCGALFHHSDCDGYITASDAKRLLKDLIAVRNDLDPTDSSLLSDDENWYREKLDDWITACEGAVECKEKIWFG